MRLARLAIVFTAAAAAAAAASAVVAQEKPAAPPPAPASPHPLEGSWELRMERCSWAPRAVPGSLAVSQVPGGLRASVTFDSMWGLRAARVTVEPAKGNEVRFQVEVSEGKYVAVDGAVSDGVFTGTANWKDANPPEKCFLSASRLPPARRFEPDSPPSPFPRESDPLKLGVDPAALDRLIHYAGRYDTDALVVVKDGKLVCDRTFLRPRGLCTLQSVTKVISSLAVPLLIEDGKLPRDLDTPLTTWFPEWKTDARKSRITLRHVLTHTSGLASDGTKAMQATSDYLAYAVASPSVHEPGTVWEYSNQGIELLAGIVKKASGMQVDDLLAGRVLAPLGIVRRQWGRDGAGNAPTYVGLDLDAVSVARIGDLVARRGRLGERQIVPEWWFDEIAKPGPVNDGWGLVWALLRDPKDETVVQTQARLDRLRKQGFAEAGRLEPMVGKTYPGRRAWWTAVFELLGREDAQKLAKSIGYESVGGEIRGPVSCVYHTGSLGQYLLVFPEHKLVVVRQRRGFASNELSEEAQARAGFSDLPRLAQDLLIR